MAETTLLVSAAFSIVGAAAYAYLGDRLGRRIVSHEARLASRAFAVWWFGLAGVSVLGAIFSLAGYFGVTQVALYSTATFVIFLLLCFSLWGLLTYLGYLFTGWRPIGLVLAIFYALYYVLIVYLVTVSHPYHTVVERWGVRVEYRYELATWWAPVVIALLLLPQILGALAYMTLAIGARDTTQRYRVLLVSISILVWFGAPYVSILFGASDGDAWQIASRIIGLAAPAMILLAYYPPAWVQRRWHIATLQEGAAA